MSADVFAHGGHVEPIPWRRRGAGARSLHHGAAASLCAAALTLAGVARAERPRIAVEHSRSDATTRRVLAEVRNAGLDPVDVRTNERGADLTELADRYRAIAVLSIKKPNRIELAVLSPETREVIYATTVTSKGGTPASVRAAEELHGRLIELPADDPPASAPPPEPAPADEAPPPAANAPPPVPAPAPAKVEEDSSALTFGDKERLTELAKDAASKTRARNGKPDKDRTALWLGASGGAASGTSRLNQVPVVQIEARLEPLRYFSVAAFALLPVVPERISAPEGTAALDARVFGAMLRATALDVAGILRLSAGAGGGAAVLSMSGEASSAKYSGRTTSTVTGMGLATMGMNTRVFPWLAVRADATCGLAAYRPVMRFDGRDVSTWGPTFAAFTGGIEIDALGFGDAQ